MKLRKEILVNREYVLNDFTKLRPLIFNGMGGTVYFMEMYSPSEGVIFQRYRNKTYIIPFKVSFYVSYLEDKICTGDGVILKTTNPNIDTEMWESIKDYVWECLINKTYEN